jgi:hypothetical protein
VIRLTDPTRIGPALAELRDLLGISRREVARQMATATGRSETSLNAQIWTWDVSRAKPDLVSLIPYLQVLGVELLLDFKQDEPQ